MTTPTFSEQTKKWQTAIEEKIDYEISKYNFDSNAKITYMLIDENLNLYIGNDPISTIIFNVDKDTVNKGDTVVCTATVLDGEDNPLKNVPVNFFDGDEIIKTILTNNNGIAVYNHIADKKGVRTLSAKIDSFVSALYEVIVKEKYDISINSEPSIIQSGETTDISAQLMQDEIPISNKDIYFFEEIEPSLTLTSNKSIIQSGDIINFTAKLKDSDGSLVQDTDVYFFEQIEE